MMRFRGAELRIFRFCCRFLLTMAPKKKKPVAKVPSMLQRESAKKAAESAKKAAAKPAASKPGAKASPGAKGFAKASAKSATKKVEPEKPK